MTFSIAARDPATPQFGVAITTSEIAVGSRCAFARGRVGAALTQHRTDPRLGPALLDAMQNGRSASEAVEHVVVSTPDARWRQVMAIGLHGAPAGYTGHEVDVVARVVAGQHCIAGGNALTVETVPAAMVRAFEAHADASMPDRLVRALEAGAAAGGEHRPLRSAALLVVRDLAFPYVDLRVDDHADPILALSELWEQYAPRAEIFVKRALDPDAI